MTRSKVSSTLRSGEASEYEKLRLDNIQRNEDFLRSLGLTGAHLKRPNEDKTKTSKRKKKVIENYENDSNGSVRRSLRVKMQPPEDSYFNEESNNKISVSLKERYELNISIDNEDLDDKRIRITAQQLRDLIEQTNADHLDIISDDVITHTAYRMSYMSNTALATRLKAIARAAGKNSHEKLLVFYYALLASGLVQLAEAAKIALNRLGQVVDN